MLQANPIKAIKINPRTNGKEPILQPLYDRTEHPYMYQVCTVCQKCLKVSTKILANDVVYCVGCFAKELPQCPSYKVTGHLEFSMTSDSWPASHELLLLQSIQRFGFGNWKDIQEHMAYFGARYTILQLENHYNKFYGKSQNFCPCLLPQIMITKGNNETGKSGRAGKNLRAFDYTNKMDEQYQLGSNCYNPKRGEFITDYNEDLEKYVCDLEFRDDDSPEETQIKYQLLEAYNQGLADRYEKNAFIIEHKLFDHQYQLNRQRKLQASEYLSMAESIIRPLMKFCSLEQYNQLLSNLEFCLKIEALIDGMRQIRSQKPHLSLKSIGSVSKLLDSVEKNKEGRPRKRVHHNDDQKKNSGTHNIMGKLGISKDEVKKIMQAAKVKKQPFMYKGIKVRHFSQIDS